MYEISQSIDNHGKSIEEAARIEATERKETANKERRVKADSEARAAILCLGVEKQELRIKKAIAHQENNQVLVNIYQSQILTVAAQIDLHQTILASDHENNNTPKKNNTKPKKKLFN
jgi:hypothetical protein